MSLGTNFADEPNIVESLAQNDEIGRGWKFLIFHIPAVWQGSRKFPTFFFGFLWDASENHLQRFGSCS